MGIADVRIALTPILKPLGTPSEVRMSYRGGGKQQVITFKLGATPYEIVVPGGVPFMPALQSAAEIFVANYNPPEGP